MHFFLYSNWGGWYYLVLCKYDSALRSFKRIHITLDSRLFILQTRSVFSEINKKHLWGSHACVIVCSAMILVRCTWYTFMKIVINGNWRDGILSLILFEYCPGGKKPTHYILLQIVFLSLWVDRQGWHCVPTVCFIRECTMQQ